MVWTLSGHEHSDGQVHHLSMDPARLLEWNRLLSFATARSDGTWLFRGHSRAAFHLCPGAGRRSPYGGAGYRVVDEQVCLADFKADAVRFMQGFGLNDLDWLAVAQHHGLPTRLLDWSTNPLVAAWFAVQDVHGEDAEIHAIRVRSSERKRDVDPWSPGADVTIVRVPAAAARITAQQGCFSLHVRPDTVWDPTTSGFMHATHPLPSSCREFLRFRLKTFGIDVSRLMQDLDSIGAELAWNYERRP